MAEKKREPGRPPGSKNKSSRTKVLPGQVQKPERRRRKFSLRKKQTDV